MSPTSILVLVVIIAAVVYVAGRSSRPGPRTRTRPVTTADVVCRLSEDGQARAADERTATFEAVELREYLDGKTSASLYGLRMQRLHSLPRTTRRQPGPDPDF